MDIKRLNQIIGEGVGQASLCWQPRPQGVFDSTEASKVVDMMKQQILECVKDSMPSEEQITEILIEFDKVRVPDINFDQQLRNYDIVNAIHAIYKLMEERRPKEKK